MPHLHVTTTENPELIKKPIADRIICGDSIETLGAFPKACVDLVVMDPPYFVRYRDRNGRTLANDANPNAVLPVYSELFRVMKPNSYCITFYGWNAIAEFSAAWASAGFRSVGHIVWEKSYASKRGFAQYRHESAFILAKGRPSMPRNPISDVLRWKYTGNKFHPTQKSVDVISPLVKCYSKPGDTVLDPFSGSGTTALSAALHDRRYIGIELEQKYCDIAEKRLEGLRRKLLRSGESRYAAQQNH